MISGRMHLHAISLSPIHHGGSTAGNTQLVRRQETVDPDTGQVRRIPFVSGRSFKHIIREWGARFALQAMGMNDANWTKAQRDLLISGGTFSKGGSSVRLDAARKLETAFPILRLCGYAAGNRGAASKLNVDNWHLICAGNRWRTYERLTREAGEDTREGKQIGGALELRAPQLLSEDFGTRMEPTDPNVNRLLSTDEQQRIAAETGDKKNVEHADKGDSLQMIYDYEVVKPGAQWMGCIYYRELSDIEAAALAGALHHACEDVTEDGRQIYRIGGKSSVGLGKVAVKWFGSLREDIRPPEHVDHDAIVKWGEGHDMMSKYVEHLRAHKDDVKEAMEALL